MYILLLAALEYHLATAESVKLVLLGRHLRKIRQTGLDRLEEALKILNSTRYVQDQPSRARKDLRNTSFPHRLWEEGDSFIAIARMSKERFWTLVDLIKSSEVFRSQSNNKQVPVSWQLLVALANLGSSGNGGDHSHLAYMFHISGTWSLIVCQNNPILRAWLVWICSRSKSFSVICTLHQSRRIPARG